MKTFSIIYSHYTGTIFAWEGDRKYQSKYLGNRVVLDVVSAISGSAAIEAWKSRDLGGHHGS